MANSYRCPQCKEATNLQQGMMKSIRICKPCPGGNGKLSCVRCANIDLKDGKTPQHKICERCGLIFKIVEKRKGYFKFVILKYRTGWGHGNSKGFKVPTRDKLHYGR